MCFLIRFPIDFYISYRAKAAPAFSAGAVFVLRRIVKLFRPRKIDRIRERWEEGGGGETVRAGAGYL